MSKQPISHFSQHLPDHMRMLTPIYEHSIKNLNTQYSLWNRSPYDLVHDNIVLSMIMPCHVQIYMTLQLLTSSVLDSDSETVPRVRIYKDKASQLLNPMWLLIHSCKPFRIFLASSIRHCMVNVHFLVRLMEVT